MTNYSSKHSSPERDERIAKRAEELLHTDEKIMEICVLNPAAAYKEALRKAAKEIGR